MDDAVVVHVLEADHDARHEKLGLLLCKALLFVVMVPEVSTCHEVSHEVDVLKVSKGVEHINQEPAVESQLERSRKQAIDLRVFKLR